MTGTSSSNSPLDANTLQEFQFIVESLDLGLWRFDLATRSLDWDTSVYRRYGVDRDAFPNLFDFWAKCLTKDSIVRAEQEMRLALSGEKEYEATYELMLPHGETRHVLARAKVFRDKDGLPTHLYGLNMDVTAQTNIELENQRLLFQLREAQSIAQIGSWSFDLTTQALTWSSELYRIYEITEPQPSDKLYGLYRSKIHPDDQDTLDKLIAHSIQTGEGYVLNYRLVLGNGGIRHVQGIGHIYKDQNGNPFQLAGTCRDQTKEIELQKKLDAERAKSNRNARLASLGELSAGVAHEINNPLAIIDGNARMLSRSTSDPVTLSAKINSILNACNRISKIIGGLKKFARTSEVTSFEGHSLREILKEALELVEAKANLFHTDIIAALDTKAQILCDRIQIEQTLINLINNAIDATKDRHEKWVKVSVLEEGAFVVISVTDSGAQIAKETQEKLFTPFFTTKEIGEGTGLGLSISKGIVEDHGGTIKFLEEATNTCFEVRLPLLDPEGPVPRRSG